MDDHTVIYNILDGLSESDFKRFKSCLSKPILEGFTPIPWRKLEKADVTDVERLMNQHYGGREGSMEMTRHIMSILYPPGKSSQDVSAASTWQTLRPDDALEGDNKKEEKKEEEDDSNFIGTTHVANATERPVRVYFSEEIIETILVTSSDTWWPWQDKKVLFRPNSCDPYLCVPAKTYERLSKRGPFYVSVFLESSSASGECAKTIAENVRIPNNGSFIITKKHTFERQKLDANIWKDEQGKNPERNYAPSSSDPHILQKAYGRQPHKASASNFDWIYGGLPARLPAFRSQFGTKPLCLAGEMWW
ncbi:uncharacterized protein LOC134453874 [Engraulis encrasicolus]|uniref:uncharacterized protein LOC134453874 n=1 Tax=Engraulis encrasicolus TaxID=184585 RepID=UPI002FD6F03A